MTGHTNSVDQLCFDPTNPNCLASASADRSVRIWDTRSPQKPIRVIATSGENINIVYSPDGSHLAVGNKEDLVSIIDTRKYQTIKSTQFPFEVRALQESENHDLHDADIEVDHKRDASCGLIVVVVVDRSTRSRGIQAVSCSS